MLQELPVHSVYLELRSEVMEEAVRLAREQELADGKLRIPMPSTSVEEGQALLAILYSEQAESYIDQLSCEAATLLAAVSHRFAFLGILQVVDRSLASKCGSQAQGSATGHNTCLSTINAVPLFWEARSRGLPLFEAECAHFIGRNITSVQVKDPSDPLAAILQQAAKFGTAEKEKAALAKMNHRVTLLQIRQELDSMRAVSIKSSCHSKLDTHYNAARPLLEQLRHGLL